MTRDDIKEMTHDDFKLLTFDDFSAETVSQSAPVQKSFSLPLRRTTDLPSDLYRICVCHLRPSQVHIKEPHRAPPGGEGASNRELERAYHVGML